MTYPTPEDDGRTAAVWMIQRLAAPNGTKEERLVDVLEVMGNVCKQPPLMVATVRHLLALFQVAIDSHMIDPAGYATAASATAPVPSHPGDVDELIDSLRPKHKRKDNP